MPSVLVAYASRHGATRGIAERIGAVIRGAGLPVIVAPTSDTHDVGLNDAFVVGSGVYLGHWLPEGIDFLSLHEGLFSTRPVWLFSSGPLADAAPGRSTGDPVTDALGPVEGPGSGGRRRLEEYVTTIHPRDHRVFRGAFDPTDPPAVLSERLVRLLPTSKTILPAGDFRDWEAIEAWAAGIAAALRTPVGSR